MNIFVICIVIPSKIRSVTPNMFKEIRLLFVAIVLFHIANAIYLRRSLTKKSENSYRADHKVIKFYGNDRKPRYLYIRKNGSLHPVINGTTVAVHAGYFTLIGLGFLSVLNAAAKQLSTKPSSSTEDDENTQNSYLKSNTTSNTIKYRRKRKRPFSYTFTTLPPIEPYDDIEIDFDNAVDDKPDAEYEEELRQYEKDYEHYLKEYAAWNETYGDLYRNAESASVMVATSSQLDSHNFRFNPNTRRRKERYRAI